MGSFWRDVKRGWNLGTHSAGQAARGLGERLGLHGRSAEDHDRRAARAEVEGWDRAAPLPSPPPASPTTAAPPAAAAPPPSPVEPRETKDPTGTRDLTEPELEDRIRRRTL